MTTYKSFADINAVWVGVTLGRLVSVGVSVNGIGVGDGGRGVCVGNGVGDGLFMAIIVFWALIVSTTAATIAPSFTVGITGVVTGMHATKKHPIRSKKKRICVV